MLILLHGALGAHPQFDALRPLLDERDILALDFEGHGSRAGHNRPFNIAHFADDVGEQIAAHGGGSAAIFGYSLGGYVALHLAATQPDLVSRVFTFNTKIAWTPETAEREVAQLNPEKIKEKVPRFATSLAERHTGAGWEHVVHHTAALLRSLGNSPVVTQETLARIQCPVRLSVGDRDHMVTVEEQQTAIVSLTRGELEVLPGTPHAIERAPLARLAWSLNDFLR